MGNERLEKIEKVLNDVLAALFPPNTDDEGRINSARITSSRLKAFNRTKVNAQFDLPPDLLAQKKAADLMKQAADLETQSQSRSMPADTSTDTMK